MPITGELTTQSIILIDSHQGVPRGIRSGRQITHNPTWMDVKNTVMNEIRDRMRCTTIYIAFII